MAAKMADYRRSASGRMRLLFEPRIRGTSAVKDLEYRVKIILGIA